MADVPNPAPITNPLGTPFDSPATPADLANGQPGVTLFALLKGILLQLAALNEDPNSVGGSN